MLQCCIYTPLDAVWAIRDRVYLWNVSVASVGRGKCDMKNAASLYLKRLCKLLSCNHTHFLVWAQLIFDWYSMSISTCTNTCLSALILIFWSIYDIFAVSVLFLSQQISHSGVCSSFDKSFKVAISFWNCDEHITGYFDILQIRRLVDYISLFIRQDKNTAMSLRVVL